MGLNVFQKVRTSFEILESEVELSVVSVVKKPRLLMISTSVLETCGQSSLYDLYAVSGFTILNFKFGINLL